MTDAGSNLKVAPLRSLDDFLLESARFQVPNFNDLEKWSNRVYQNLLYYQTNYMLTYFIVFLIVGVIHPTKMFYGIVAFGLFFYLSSNKQLTSKFKKEHPVLSLICVILATYSVTYLLGSVIVFLLGILLPILVIFVHASMRLRNLKNKVLNKMEWVGMQKSPMGVLLEFLGLEQEFTM